MKRAHARTIMPLLRAGTLAVLASAPGGVAAAQAMIDQVPRTRTVTTREVVDADMESARLSLGPLRVIPMIVMDEAGYDSNVFNAPQSRPEEIVGDWTATVGFGGRGILPMGSKMFLRLIAVPQYIWYNQLADRRTWAGDFGGSYLALGNRLQFEATGRLNRGLTLLSSETQATVVETDTTVGGKLEVGLTRALSLVGGVRWRQTRYLPESQAGSPEPIDVQLFDRTDTSALAGLRLRLTSSLDVTGGVQGTRAEFDENSLLRDNQTYAFLGGIHFDRPRFFVNLAGGYRRAGSFNGSSFPDYATTVGSYFVSWKVAGPLELQAFGHRRPVYSRSNTALFYIETRYGGRVQLRLGSRTSVYGSGEAGTNFYPVQFLPGGAHRDDDGIAYGGGLTFRFLENVAVELQARQTILRFSTGDPERRVFRFTTGLSFNGEFKRE
jgi:opacity protein-like surface antigen